MRLQYAIELDEHDAGFTGIETTAMICCDNCAVDYRGTPVAPCRMNCTVPPLEAASIAVAATGNSSLYRIMKT